VGKKKKVQPKLVAPQDRNVSDFDSIHLDITFLTGKEIQMRVDRHKYYACTCARVGCDHTYAYTGKNPHYCPKCLKFMKQRGKKDG